MPAILATTNDIERISRLATDIWLKHYPAIIGEEQTRYMLNKMYSVESLLKQMENGNQFYIWLENNVPIGFAAINTQHFQYGFLSKFYLDENYRGKGIAQQFFIFLEERFQENNREEIQLTVNRVNIGAINFYFKVGFKILRSEDVAIGDGYFMNDFVMVKKTHGLIF